MGDSSSSNPLMMIFGNPHALDDIRLVVVLAFARAPSKIWRFSAALRIIPSTTQGSQPRGGVFVL